MLTIIAEQPLLVSFLIGVVVVGLAYGWLQTGEKRLALGAAGAASLIPVTFLISNLIETDREMIRKVIATTVAAVESNDHEKAAAVIADSKTRQRALAEMPSYDFHSIRARNIQIRFVQGSFPPEAIVDLDASVRASQVRGSIKNASIVRRVILTFQKQQDDRWVVIDYTHVQLNGQPDMFTPQRI